MVATIDGNASSNGAIVHQVPVPGSDTKVADIDVRSSVDLIAYMQPSKLVINLAETLKPLPDLSRLAFGQSFSDHMLVMSYDPTTGWSAPVIQPYQPLQLDPASSCFQYATNLFEGMKAYPHGTPRLFRPELNMARMKTSAERLALPPFDTDALLTLIKKLVAVDRRWIPDLPGHSLYLRPTMIGTRPCLGVAASTHAMIYVICCPAGPYFGASVKRIPLYACYDSVRSWPGGTGGYKLGLNYASTFEPQRRAAKKGYAQVLWLLGDEHKVTEAGAMNFFVIVRRTDGDLDVLTPPLDGTILPGVTRNSVLALAAAHSPETPLPGLSPTLRLHTHERVITMPELREYSSKGDLLEAFCVGTAAIVAPVDRIGYEGEDIVLPEDAPVADALCERIEAIQEGRFEWDGWSVRCE
ncbi:branched-chain amino acid aminotransferase II [Phellopilus nigrolimitatus]|nr:branched-chain amino acid aminotransferase II [Phellopilus nigrolimitatus]